MLKTSSVQMPSRKLKFLAEDLVDTFTFCQAFVRSYSKSYKVLEIDGLHADDFRVHSSLEDSQPLNSVGNLGMDEMTPIVVVFQDSSSQNQV